MDDLPGWVTMLSEFFRGMLTQQKLNSMGADPKNSITLGADLGSGYSVDADRAAKVHKLRQLQLEAVNNPAWQPSPDGRTFCNRASDFIAQGMGYFGFPNGSMANFMITRMACDPAWKEEPDLHRAHAHAMRGGLTFATLIEEPHGHLCSFSPEPMQFSNTWGAWVPVTANVGKKNGVMRLSGAFTAASRPSVRYFLLHPEGV